MKKYIVFFIISFLLVSCANVGTLTGGAKDEKEPVIISSNLKPINFNDKIIILKFDEYVELNNAKTNIYLQPNHSSIIAKQKGKTITLNIDSNLRSNTTYQLVIDKGIKDINEGNLFNFDYLFSTGDILDSAELNIYYSSIHKIEKLNINLYSEKPDSFVINQYDYKVEFLEQRASFKGLKENKTYYYFIYQDKDKNNQIDLNSNYKIDTISPQKLKKINAETIFDIENKIDSYKDRIVIKKSSHNPNYSVELLKNFKDSFKNLKLIFSDKDSMVLLKNNLDSQKMYLKQLLSTSIENNLQMYSEPKKFHYMLYKSQLNFKIKELDTVTYEDDNLIYYESKIKRDSLHLILMDDTNIQSKIITSNYKPFKEFSELKIKNDSAYHLFVLIFKDNRIIHSLNIEEKNARLPLSEGEYLIEIYNSKNINNNLLSNPLYYKKINLKPNWKEEIIINKE
ncbi:MAG: Ig-like domain-containing protein [Bacteroidota bacterium]|nr:Ig-like domain-containing protein [Bacteroidota bacterium]